MRGSWLAVLLLLLPGCAQSSGGVQAEPDGPRPGLLEGVVVDEAIRPVANANVSLSNGAAMDTGSDGTFRFPDVEAGTYVLRAARPGYADAVTTVTVLASDITPTVKLVLISDPSSLNYVEEFVIDGFVQCSLYFPPSYRFAACGTGNVGSVILCSYSGGQVCLGDLTEDRYITIMSLDSPPEFLQTETVWSSTQASGDQFYILIGSATEEQLRQPTSEVYNDTKGPSPLLATMDAADIAESGIGVDAYFLSQTFAAPTDALPPCAGPVCTGVGVVAQQTFRMFLHAFHGFVPPEGWRFSQAGEAPTPP